MEEISGQMKIYIPIEQLKDNHVYEVDGRNFIVAVWKERQRRFYGVRKKWGDIFIDNELHWDDNEHPGTVKPLKDIGEYNYCPMCGRIDDEKLIDFLTPIENEIYKRRKEQVK